MPSGTALSYSMIMLLTGIGIPVMAALNSQLGVRLANPAAASAVVGLPDLAKVRAAPPHLFFSGAFVAFYVLSITWIGPRFGIGNAVFLVLLGQIVAAALIDHFGLFGVPRSPLTALRIGGMVLMTIGVLMARKIG
ncbi:DMT family transporter [Blastomonas sp.]|uniref:DMT family transporter n=1 Tax=Blastomonas TaxID=150203 RepID=UPI002589AFC9|nr:DMT family transporter [Blastomonas sp.]